MKNIHLPDKRHRGYAVKKYYHIFKKQLFFCLFFADCNIFYHICRNRVKVLYILLFEINVNFAAHFEKTILSQTKGR